MDTESTASTPNGSPGSPGSPRLIYAYHNGQAPVKADPAVLWRKLLLASRTTAQRPWPDLYGDWTKACEPQPDEPGGERVPNGTAPAAPDPEELRLDLQEQVVAVVRAAFGIAPLDAEGHGLTEAETIDALYAFFVWQLEKKASGGTPPSGSASTASDPPDTSNPSTAP